MSPRRAEGEGPTREALEKLLALLDPDPARAARQFSRLRRQLVRMFEWRRARFPEDLADETISRVGRRLAQGVEIRAEDPNRYFFGVAHMVFKEVLRENRRESRLHDPGQRAAVEEPGGEDVPDERMELLGECLERLDENDRLLLLDYLEGESRERIERRRRMAERLGIPLNALRIRVHRLRRKVERCVRQRMRALEAS